MRLGLEPMRAACTRSGNPEHAFAVVHVAGTNGKGSTSAMVESMARASGLRTGLYTSPHLARFAERIRIDGEPITDDELTAVLARALDEGSDLSFFETATLAAFLAFRDRKVDLAVIEVGIGGRLDATNVVPPPRCAALVRVALDHMDRLGDTLEAIAREKAAIAKPGSPFVIGALPPSVRAAAIEVAESARICEVDDGDRASVAMLPIGLAGAHQRENAAVAWRIAREIDLPEDARRKGLASVKWPGRLERIAGNWILDGAHNPDGARALVAALHDADVGALVFGSLADKQWDEMLDVLGAIDCPRVFVAPRGRAAVDAEGLAHRFGGTASAAIHDAQVSARPFAPERDVVVCGSLYLVGEARAKLLGLPLDPPVAL
jgi:dihydrofolate synthase/folylpolyglutamate synthase